ncbi:MAG: cytochrome c3 family protein [Pseudodesulfovibrio sp.]
MHRFIMTTMTLCVLILASALAWAAVEAPADLKLGPPEGMKVSKTLVDFSHAKHGEAKVECATCHHTWDGTSEVKSCSYAGCHDQPGKKGETAFYVAFHAKKSEASCLGCHKILKKSGNKVVPVSCKACHPK